MMWNVPPSSAFICLKTSHAIQETDFCAKSPCTVPPQNVPATAQQIRPPLSPPLMPLLEVSVAAGQTPRSDVFAPPDSLPHFFNSQQFFFWHCCLLPLLVLFIYRYSSSETWLFLQVPAGDWWKLQESWSWEAILGTLFWLKFTFLIELDSSI